MVDSNRWVARLCWALVILAVISAIVQIGMSLALFVPFPDVPEGTDLVDRLVTIRAADQQVFPFVALGNLATIGVYVVVGLLGVALRNLASPGTARDAMAILFLIAASVGIVSQVVNLAAAHVATFGYCDCGYRTEEVIAQDYVLNMGFTMQMWLGLAALTLLGAGAALAGRLIAVSSAWRVLSYVIAALLLIAVAVRLLAAFVFIAAFDPFQVTDLLIGLTAGILVPIWAIMLARSLGRGSTADVTPAAA